MFFSQNPFHFNKLWTPQGTTEEFILQTKYSLLDANHPCMAKKNQPQNPSYAVKHLSIFLLLAVPVPLYHQHIQHLSMQSTAIHLNSEHTSTRKRSSQLNNTHPYTSKCPIQSNKKKYSPVPFESPRAPEPQSPRAQTALQTKTKANAK